MSADNHDGGASVSTEPAAGSSTGTDVSLRDYVSAQRTGDLRFNFERDRRYTEIKQADDRRLTEVAIEREKALKIKETADLAALSLAREIQTYKDEKANELRSQIERERGTYATKEDLAAAVRELNVMLKPLTAFVDHERGGQDQRSITAGQLALMMAVATVVVTILILVLP